MRHICIIAEAGVNHNGDLELAKKMVKEAKKAGADYIKFQTFMPKNLVSKYAEKAKYQKEATGEAETQLQMLQKLTLSNENFTEIKKCCMEEHIGFISSPFDLESISFLEGFDMDFWKIPSGEVTNLPYLEAIAKTGRKVVMSTGMCEMTEIQDAISVLEENGSPEILLLHCNTQYPTPYRDVNLKAMAAISAATGKKVGYSDHTPGIEIPIAAAALGAIIIEKHFTLNKNMNGPDHKASLEPFELYEMISGIRHIEQALGNGKKEPSQSETDNKKIVRKSIVAKCNIKEGEILSENNLTTKRPGYGISPMLWHSVIGKKAVKNFLEDEMIVL